MKTAVIIPARMGSMRFPGKVLADLGGKPVIQHVWVYLIFVVFLRNFVSQNLFSFTRFSRLWSRATAAKGRLLSYRPN